MQQYADIYLLQSHSTCFGCTAPIIRSAKNCNRNRRPRWREVAVPKLWPVPEVAVTIFSTRDDECCDTRNMYSDFAVNKYLRNVACGWIFINIAWSLIAGEGESLYTPGNISGTHFC